MKWSTGKTFAAVCAATSGLVLAPLGPSPWAASGPDGSVRAVMAPGAPAGSGGPLKALGPAPQPPEARAGGFQARPSASSPAKTEIEAEVLPAATFAVGTSLSGGPDGKNYGVALTANDISNSWTTCTSTCTLDFVFFVFSSRDETAKVQFRVVSPTGGGIYQYTWSSKLVQTNWYSAYAKGNYAVPGTYFGEVYVNGSLAGWAPVVFTKS